MGARLSTPTIHRRHAIALRGGCKAGGPARGRGLSAHTGAVPLFHCLIVPSSHCPMCRCDGCVCDRRGRIVRPCARGCGADAVRPPRVSLAPRDGPSCAMGPHGLLWCRDSDLPSHVARVGAAPPGRTPSRGLSAGRCGCCSRMWGRPGHRRGMAGPPPPDVGALRGPVGPLFRCPFPSLRGDGRDRNSGSVTVCGRFRAPSNIGSPRIRSPNRAAVMLAWAASRDLLAASPVAWTTSTRARRRRRRYRRPTPLSRRTYWPRPLC